MSERRPDIDKEQGAKDANMPNEYRLLDDYVINDGLIHSYAIICPGGGYGKVSSYIEGTPIAKKLNEQGISAFVLYYRIKEKALYPAPMDDLARAVRYTQENATKYNLDQSNYSIWGSSAGGHLAASFGTENMGYLKFDLPRPKVIVLAYPVISMEKHMSHQGTRNRLIGEDANAEMEEFTSIEKHITKSFPPVFIWCGENDQTVNPENTRMMEAALKEAGVPVCAKIFKNASHGIGPGTGTDAEGWIRDAVEFWMMQK